MFIANLIFCASALLAGATYEDAPQDAPQAEAVTFFEDGSSRIITRHGVETSCRAGWLCSIEYSPPQAKAKHEEPQCPWWDWVQDMWDWMLD